LPRQLDIFCSRPFMLAHSFLFVSKPPSCPANNRASTTLPFLCFQSLPTIKLCNSSVLITIQNARGGASPLSSSSLPYLLPSSPSRKSFICHSSKNCRGVPEFFQFWNRPDVTTLPVLSVDSAISVLRTPATGQRPFVISQLVQIFQHERILLRSSRGSQNKNASVILTPSQGN
jgi:hypothetical protein